MSINESRKIRLANEIQPERPLNSPFQDFSKYSSDELKTLNNNQELIFRCIKPGESDFPKETATENNSHYATRFAIVAKKLFAELEESFNIKVTPTSFFVANEKDTPARFADSDEKSAAVYSVSKRVEGIKLSELNPGDLTNNELEEIRLELERYYLGIFNYLIKKLSLGQYYLFDIVNQEQYLFGKLEDQEEKHLYLVDTDSLLRKAKREDVLVDFEFLLRRLLMDEKKWGSLSEVRYFLLQNIGTPLFGPIIKKLIKFSTIETF